MSVAQMRRHANLTQATHVRSLVSCIVPRPLAHGIRVSPRSRLSGCSPNTRFTADRSAHEFRKMQAGWQTGAISPELGPLVLKRS